MNQQIGGFLDHHHDLTPPILLSAISDFLLVKLLTLPHHCHNNRPIVEITCP